MSTLRRQVGAMVRHHRERLNMTQTELGDLVGKSLETIGRIERGTTAPSLDLLERLAAALNVEPRDLLGIANHAAKTRKADPLARLVEALAGLSDADIERAERLLAIAMEWKSPK